MDQDLVVVQPVSASSTRPLNYDRQSSRDAATRRRRLSVVEDCAFALAPWVLGCLAFAILLAPIVITIVGAWLLGNDKNS